MKTKILLFSLIFVTNIAVAQKFIAKTGHIWFYSYTSMEVIEAHNHQVVSILDPSTGDIIFNLLNKSFEFKVALMQEHFNENYMESTKFPKSTFKGKITNLDKIDFKKDGTYPAEVTGDLTMHGVTKNISTAGTIEVSKGVITAKAKFKVVPKDYGIQIPQLVENKIAKEMEITVEIPYAAN
jgi:hypothetical protein